MKLPEDYDETVGITGDFETVEAGGYICKIISAKVEKSKNNNEMLVIAFDIASGEHEGIYQRRFEQAKNSSNNTPDNPAKWPNDGIHRLVITNQDGKCNKFFKGFITSVEESNDGYKFKTKKNEADEKTLKGKLFGAIIGRTQYESMTGELRFNSRIKGIRSIQVIEDGKYEVPQDELLEKQNNSLADFNVNNSDDDDLPF